MLCDGFVSRLCARVVDGKRRRIGYIHQVGRNDLAVGE